MARRTKRFRRSFAGMQNGRSFFWFRFTPFSLTSREVSTATRSDIMLTESDWANPSVTSNQTRKGGPRMERLIIDFGLSVEGDVGFWDAALEANIAFIPEFMIWKQSDQFVSLVTSSATFDDTRENQRIIMDEIPSGEREFTNIDPTSTAEPCIRSVQGKYETKSKVRLSEGSLGIAWRGLFDEGATELRGFTDWVRPTILISLP